MTTGSSPQGPRAHSRLAEIIVACATFTKAPAPRACPCPNAFDVSDLVARLSCNLCRQMLVAVFVVCELSTQFQLGLGSDSDTTYQFWLLLAQLLIALDSRQCCAHFIWMLESTSTWKEWDIVSWLTRNGVLCAEIAIVTP